MDIRSGPDGSRLSISDLAGLGSFFYYYRWTCARTNRYYLSCTELCAKSIFISRKSSPLEKGWFTLQRTILQFKLETFGKQSRFRRWTEPKPSNVWSFKESCSVDLTLHCCACGLREEWNKQEIDEVDEGQGIVPEQASCREKKRNTDWTANPPFEHNKQQQISI